MVLIDTSIWIRLYRRQAETLGELLWALVGRNEAAICGQVWLEFIGGFRRESERKEYADAFGAFPWLDTNREAYVRAAEWLALHPALGPGDVIIAATALTHHVPLFTADEGFRSLTRYGLGLLR